MVIKPIEPFKVIGKTSKMEGCSYGIALSPAAPLVADIEYGDQTHILRVTNYETGDVIGQNALPSGVSTLSFSPDGKFIFALVAGSSSFGLEEEAFKEFRREYNTLVLFWYAERISDVQYKELQKAGRILWEPHPSILAKGDYWGILKEGEIEKPYVVVPVDDLAEQVEYLTNLTSHVRDHWNWRSIPDKYLRCTEHLLNAQMIPESVIEELDILEKILENLTPIEKQEFFKEDDFLNAVASYIGEEYAEKYKAQILNQLRKTRWWNRLLIYSKICDLSPIIDETCSFFVDFDADWLDNQTILVAGTSDNTLYTGTLEIESGRLRIIHQEVPSLKPENSSIVRTRCLSSGGIALVFSVEDEKSGYVEYGEFCRVVLYQLNEDRNAVLIKNSFPIQNKWADIAEDGQILVLQWPYKPIKLALFDHQNEHLDTLEHYDKLFSIPISDKYDRKKYMHFCKAGIYLCSNKKAGIYRVSNDKLYPWCFPPIKNSCCDLMTKDEKTLLAVHIENQTVVFELGDFDILQLTSEDVDQRCKAGQSLGKRRFQPAVQHLIPLIWDESSDVQKASIEALAEIEDPEALPHMVRLLGHKLGEHLQDDLISALRRFPAKHLLPVVLDCLTKPGITFRLGAVRVLEYMPSLEALENLCEAIHDADRRIRLSAVYALRKRTDMRACVALMAHLNDEDDDVRIATQEAITAILNVNNFLSDQISEHLSVPIDVASYAQDVISKGRMHEFEDSRNLEVSSFLTSLASACVQSHHHLPQILNAIEALTTTHEHAPEEVSISIALTMALICADVIKAQKRWQETIGIYRNAIILAQQIEAPQIEWRAWYAVGECFETLGNDPTALNAFRNAMDVIDRLWFALLEEDKLRDFFQDKALLYDRAGLCCLRLGHTAMALECCEKAKTRYLGDLIARRQMNPQTVLNRELKEFWKDLGNRRPTKVSTGAPSNRSKDQVEIIAVQWGEREIGAGVVKPERLAAFEEACECNTTLKENSHLIDRLWQLMAHIATLDDEEIHEHVEAIYQALLPIYQAVKTQSLPIQEPERQLILRQFHEAAHTLSDIGRRSPNAPFWLFSQFDFRWLEDICNSIEVDETALLLEAVMEALNSVLHHEPVLGIPIEEPLEEEQEGPVFVTRTLSKESTSLGRGTTIIETALARYTQTRWRYITRLARGEISNYQDIAKSLRGHPDVAQLQFVVTEHGTVFGNVKL